MTSPQIDLAFDRIEHALAKIADEIAALKLTARTSKP